jgi:5-methyltetrahydrofolate--homocysteine methyltransferase
MTILFQKHSVNDESEQLYPEQSTTAFVTYHPASKYFSA